MASMRKKALTMGASWERAFICIVPYFNLMGKYAWLNAKYRTLQGKCFWYEHIRKMARSH